MTVHPTLVIILLELTVALAVAVGIMGFFLIRGRRRDKQALEQLTQRLETKAQERQDSLVASLQAQGAEDGEQARDTAADLVKKENQFCQRLAAAFLQRDGQALGAMDQWLAELAQGYRNLIPAAPAQSTSSSESEDAPAQELSELQGKVEELTAQTHRLQEENDRLSQELEAAQKQNAGVTNEYVSAFREEPGQPGEQADPVDAEATEADQETTEADQAAAEAMMAAMADSAEETAAAADDQEAETAWTSEDAGAEPGETTPTSDDGGPSPGEPLSSGDEESSSEPASTESGAGVQEASTVAHSDDATDEATDRDEPEMTPSPAERNGQPAIPDEDDDSPAAADDLDVDALLRDIKEEGSDTDTGDAESSRRG